MDIGIGEFYIRSQKSLSNFYAGRDYSSEMPTANVNSHFDHGDASELATEAPRICREERGSDYWPDWPRNVEKPAAIEASIRNNAPAIVFGDIVRLLGMTFLVITVIDLSLRALHF
jgi:hypothetical protein